MAEESSCFPHITFTEVMIVLIYGREYSIAGGPWSSQGSRSLKSLALMRTDGTHFNQIIIIKCGYSGLLNDLLSSSVTFRFITFIFFRSLIASSSRFILGSPTVLLVFGFHLYNFYVRLWLSIRIKWSYQSVHSDLTSFTMFWCLFQ
jgi:hypothetical protein